MFKRFSFLSAIIKVFIFFLLLAVPVFAQAKEVKIEQSTFTLEVKDNLINLHAEHASFKNILNDLEKKTGIKAKIFDGVEDRKVTLDIINLPVYAIHTLLEKMEIENFAVVYDTQLASKVIYILPKGQDIAEVLKGKTSIRPARFADGKNVNQIKGHEITTITRGKNNDPIRYVKDEVLLKFHLGVTRPEIEEVLKKHNLILVDDNSLSKIGYVKAKIPDGREVTEIIKEVRNEYKVKIPEPNYIAEILTVTDPLYDNQWYVPDTNFNKAWESAKSKSTVKIAVIDTGVNAEHPDLNSKILQGYDFVNNESNAVDDHGHGTFVIGIIAAASNDIGIKGLYDYAQIIPVKVINANGIGTYEDSAKGIIFAADNGAKVINLSIGGCGYSFMLQDAVDYALEKGCIVVAAGGNDGIEQEIYPAAYPDVIGVSALGNNGLVWSSSKSGRHIDVSAPGVDILSTGLNNDYVYATGTSASAPMVSALAAMLASERTELPSSVIERLVMQSAKDLGEQGRDKIYGSGEIDALASLEQEVKPFHDVAVRSVHIEPMVFEKGKPTFIVANIENTGTYTSGKFDVVLYEIIGEEKKEIRKEERVEVIDKTKLIFEWMPEGVKDNFKFEVVVISKEDENSFNNSKITYGYSMNERDGLYVLYEVAPPVHQWIALQAYNKLSSGGLKTEIGNYLPTSPDAYWTNVLGEKIGYYGKNIALEIIEFFPPNDWELYDLGNDDPAFQYSALIEGAWEEDHGEYNIGIGDGTGNDSFCRHFWDPTGSYNYGLTPQGAAQLGCGTDQNDSSLTQAQRWWESALASYPNNKTNAYYYLGRIAHLLMDMSVPAHVLDDPHPPLNKDGYEQFTKDTSVRSDGNYRLINSDSANTNIPTPVDSSYSTDDYDKKLTDLFYKLADYTNDFDSDDRNGESAEYGQGKYNFGGWIWDSVLQTVYQPNLQARAIGYVAALYQLFWKETHPIQITSKLTFTPQSGTYYKGQTISATYKIKNVSNEVATLDKLTVGGRLNGDESCSNTGGVCQDFTISQNVTFQPGEEKTYSGVRTLDYAGNYHFFIAYERNGTWYGDWSILNESDGSLPLSDISKDISAVVDPTPPTVSITYPTNNSTVNSTITVSATAQDSDGISKVEFYLDGARQFTDSSAPYSWSWNTALTFNGAHTLLATAYDNGGNVGTSLSINVTVSNGSLTCTDTYEPNDSSGSAWGPLTSGSTYTSKICSGTDYDWYKMNIPSTGTIFLSLTVPSNSDYDMELYSPAWLSGTYKRGNGLNESINYTVSPGTYYVRVYGYPVGSGSYNTANPYTLSYNFSSSGNIPPSLTLLTPNGGETLTVGSPYDVKWNASDTTGTIQKIEVYVSTDGGMTWPASPVHTNTANVGLFTWTPATATTQARIKVVATDSYGAVGSNISNGNFSIVSSCQSPSTPTVQNITAYGSSYTVSWSATGGATYNLQQDITSSFANPVTVYSSNGTSWYSGQKENGTYYYRVRASNSCGDSSYSGTQSVTVQIDQAPGAITAISPSDGATGQSLSNVTLSWSATHPGGESLRYNVYVCQCDTTNYFSNNIKSYGQTGTTYIISNLPYNTTISWGIQAIDDNGQMSFSPMFHFKTIGDSSVPIGSISINNGAVSTDSYSVTLNLSASDSDSGVHNMRFSNDGVHWNNWWFYAPQYTWNISDYHYGGIAGLTTYTVYAQFMDIEGNVSPVYTDTIDKVSGAPGNIILNGNLYPTIRDAVDAANYGDTIYLTEGTYIIKGEINPPRFANRYVGIVLKPGITLKGAGAEKTIIDTEDIILYTVVDADDSVIEGMTIINSDTSVRYAVLLESNSSTVRNCILKGSYGAIQLGYDPTRQAINNVIINNLLVNNISDGIRGYYGSNISIFNNTIAYNNSSGIASNIPLIIKNNIIAYNLIGLAGSNLDIQNIQYNDVYGNTQENYQSISDHTGSNGNISANPSFINSSIADYHLKTGSPCINSGTNIGIPYNGSAPDMGAFEYNGTGTIQVISNRTDAMFTIIGPSDTYTGTGANWSQSNLPIGIYNITFTPIANLYSPLYQSKMLYSGQTLLFDGTYNADAIGPLGTMTIDFSEYATANNFVNISFDITDEVAGIGAGSQMMFSNDGVTWSSAEPYSSLKKEWDLTLYGGDSNSGSKTVYARVSDLLGNWTTFTDTILYVPNRQILEVPAQYSSIQTAIDTAQDGDMVYVFPGNYNMRETITLKQGVRLQGAGATQTVFTDLVTINGATNSMIDGFGGYLKINYSSTGQFIISNNIVTRGISIGWSNNQMNSIIRNNIIGDNYSGVIVSGNANVSIENNTFINNSNIAIRINQATPDTKTYLVNNVIANNNIGIVDSNTSDTAHQHIFPSFNTYWNNIKGNFGELDPYYSNANYFKKMRAGDMTADPMFVDSVNGDFHLKAGSSSISSGDPDARFNDPDGTRNNRGTYGGATLNTPPKADFSIDPPQGSINTAFTFDASLSHDGESQDALLEVRWDINGDGVYDTLFSTVKMFLQQYNSPGTYNVTMQVKDETGYISAFSKSLVIINQPPYVPSNPIPADSASGQQLDATLVWTGGDPDVNDTVTYDVYFGTTSNPPLVSSNQIDNFYNHGTVSPNTVNYWKIIAKDSYGDSSLSPLWYFVTEGPTAYYCDNDSDGYYDVNIDGSCPSGPNCPPTNCQTTQGNDCDDRPDGADGLPGTADDGANINPGKPEVCNGLDDNCNNNVDETGDALCDNGLFCDGQEICGGVSGCQSGVPVDCSPLNDQCNNGTCNENSNSCEKVPANESQSCDDGQYCNVGETCQSGVCAGGGARDCSALNDQCNAGECNEASDICEKVTANESQLCNDGQYCNVGETCQSGVCSGGGARDCSDGVGCTYDSCNEGTDSCSNIPNDAYCADDGLFCNGAEYCDAANDCVSEGDPCSPDVCNEVTDACAQQPAFEVLRTGAPPIIDGDLSEYVDAKRITISPASGGNTVTVKALWDDTALYLAYEVTDSQLNASVTTRDGSVWNEDSIEWAIDTLNNDGGSGDPNSPYMLTDDYHGIINILSTQYDSRGTVSGSPTSSWNGSWQSARKLIGTNNNNSDTDGGYTVEVKIPWTSIGYSAAPAGDTLVSLGFLLTDKDTGIQIDRVMWPDSTGSAFENAANWQEVVLSNEDVFSILRTSASPAIDCNLSEYVDAKSIMMSPATGGNSVTVKALWDDEALYLAYEVTDTQLNASVTTRDGSVWNEDSIEWAIDTLNNDGGSGNPNSPYMLTDDYHGIVNMLNTKYDSQGSVSGSPLSSWNGSWQSSACASGTTNNNADTDNGYNLEIKIPWTSIGYSVAPAGDTTVSLGFLLNDKDASSVVARAVWPQGGGTSFQNAANWQEVLLSTTVLTNYYCDDDSDGYWAALPSGVCEGYDCEPVDCQIFPGQDCNDDDDGIHPYAWEQCDQTDNDCDGVVDPGCVTYADEDFGSGLPLGWTIVDNAGTGAGWRFNDPAGRSNLTGGAGNFAIADSNYEGQVSMDAELRTSVMDFSNTIIVTLSFNTDFHVYGGNNYNEVADVDVSVNGVTGPWTTVWRKTADYRGPGTEIIDLTSSAAGYSNVVVRFRYHNANYDWWWQVDDIFIATTCDTRYYEDGDGDNYGNPASLAPVCNPTSGYVANKLDCNDANPYINPEAAETCEGLDNNCNGQIDESGGFFRPTGSMGTARSGHTATLLPNGKVLITGEGTAEIYDPETGTFTATGSMGTARSGYTVTLLQNGKVLITGGYSGGEYTTAELYDPETGTFTATGSMGTARSGYTVTLLQNGKVLITGGYSGGEYLSTAELYDPETGTFTPTGSMGIARSGYTVTLLQNGKVLITGGWYHADDIYGGYPLSTAELYDPETGTFTATGSMVAGGDEYGYTATRFGHAATLLPNGKVLITGGLGLNFANDQSFSLSSAELYDPATGTFTATGSLREARDGHTPILLHNGKVLIVGGQTSCHGGNCYIFDNDNYYDNYDLSVELYDPTTGTFTATGSMGIYRYGYRATLLQNGKVLITGGCDYPWGDECYSTAELYDPATGTFTATGSMGAARSGHTATLLNSGKVLIAGPGSSAELFQSISCEADLVISAMMAPAASGAGKIISVSTTTKNIGAATVWTSVTKLYLSTDMTYDAGDTYLGQRTISPLAAGISNTGSISITIPPGASAGTNYILARADGTSIVAEANEANNEMYKPIIIGPDLVVSAMTTPATSGAGKIISVSTTIKNAGGSNALASTVKLYLSTDMTYDAGDTYLGQRAIPALAAGVSSTGSTSVTIPAGAIGPNYIVARADGNSIVAEANEANNDMYKPIIIGPDLVVSAMTVPATSGEGKIISVSTTIKNAGGGNALASTVRVYLSTDMTYDAGDTYLGQRAIPALAAGVSSTGSTSVTIPAGAIGPNYIVARADADLVIAEAKEANNDRYKPIIIARPDLVVSAMTVPATSGAGKIISVSTTIKNAGGINAVASTVRLYLSTDMTYDAGDTYLGQRAIPALAVGVSSTGSTSVTIPAGAIGPNYIIAKADDDFVIAEANEANNDMYKPIIIGPDLVVSAITSPLSAARGASISISETTRNMGAGNAGASTTRLYLSADTTYGPGDRYLGQRAVPALAAGVSNVKSTSVVIPATIVPGTNYIISVSDANGVVVETNETNNIISKVISIL